MKKLLHPGFNFLAIAIIFAVMGCSDKVEVTQTYTVMEPIYMTPEEIRSAVEISEPENINALGKIYLYGHFVFVNEPSEGIHVVNNSDPANPEIVNFINIPGNFNMSIKGDILYADSYIDLVAIDISNMNDIKVVNRIEDIFSNFNQMQQSFYDPEKGVIVDWSEVQTITVTEEDFAGGYPSYFKYSSGVAFLGASDEAANVSRTMIAPTTPQVGIGGSMARFTIYGDYLYGVDHSHLFVFDISDLNNPQAGFKKELGWGIETIFPYQDKLFIGSETGMHIYDISKPDIPLKLSVFEHIRSCDPVVVQDTIAYVTLRGGNGCRNGFTNQLDVIDVSDPTNPELITSHNMDNPHGLGIDDNLLFICEGGSGLKIFNVTDYETIPQNMIAQFSGLDAFDVIPFNDILIMIGQDGLYQFDYSTPEDIKLLSGIPIIEETAEN